MKFSDAMQSADWKSEKHVPVIDCPASVKAGETFAVTVSVGKEVAHPNTTEHHIRWIQVYFKPDDDKFAYQVALCEFNAHAEAVAGANEGPVTTHHSATINLSVKSSGTILAMSLCNIHGLWENSAAVKVS